MATTVTLQQAGGHPPIIGEVARLRMPVRITGMDKMMKYLEESYGKQLSMFQDGDWLVFTTEPL